MMSSASNQLALAASYPAVLLHDDIIKGCMDGVKYKYLFLGRDQSFDHFLLDTDLFPDIDRVIGRYGGVYSRH